MGATTLGPEAPSPELQGHLRRRARLSATVIALSVAVAASVLVAVTIGPADLSVAEVWSVVLDHLGGPDSGLTVLRDNIVWELRLPRVLVAGIVGASLGLVGAVMQTLTRNPLADPYLLGISSGASFGAVLVLVVGVGAGIHALSVGAFTGAIGAFALVLLFGRRGRRLLPARMILAGVAVGQFFNALMSTLIVWRADPQATRNVTFWLLGSLSAARWSSVVIGAAALAGVLLLYVWHHRAFDAFAFGDDSAATLGIDVDRLRWVVFVATALLTGCIVAISGAIGFVGLVIPHAVRFVVGPDHRRLLPVVGLVGAIFLIWVDVIARTAFAPRELPVGVVTAFVGVPAFVLLMRRAEVRG
ncbi:MAG: iron chelate uptake ABC transporter family permease subunit [Actinomycetota bacterium]